MWQATRTASSGRQDARRQEANANVSNAVIDMLSRGDLYAGESFRSLLLQPSRVCRDLREHQPDRHGLELAVRFH